MIKPPQGRFPDANFARAFSHQHPDKPVRQSGWGSSVGIPFSSN
jgi:hypothetical protein